jgi:integrase
MTGISNSFGKAPIHRQVLSKTQYRSFLTILLGPQLACGSLLEFRTAWIEFILFQPSARWGDMRNLSIKHFKFSAKDLQVMVPTRKNDRAGVGHSVFLKRRNSLFCPVALTEKYFRLL